MNWQNILVLLLTGQAPVTGVFLRWLITERRKHMKLIVDLEKDLELLKGKFERLIPEASADVAALVRQLSAKALGSGLTVLDIRTGLLTVVAELEEQARTQGLPV